MKINVGNFDRLVRIVIGLVLISLPFWLESPWRWLGLIGVMPLFTASPAAVRVTGCWA